MAMMMGRPMMMSRPYYYGYGYADDPIPDIPNGSNIDFYGMGWMMMMGRPPIPDIPYGSNSLFITNYGDYNQYDITQGGIQGGNSNLQPVRWP